MNPTPEPYVHALRFRSLTRFYDRVLRVTLKEKKFKQLLVAQASVQPGERVLDVGCGTGTLTILLKRAAPEAGVVSLDGDAEALAVARDKAAREGVELVQSLAWEAPFERATFDRVVSSLVFHHLTTENKRRTLQRIREWLRPSGELHVADWGRPHDPLMRAAFLPVQMLEGFETTSDSVRGVLPSLMREAGFAEVTETHRERTLFGTLSLYRAA